MMDCRRAKEMLPLWVGQDLPDAVSHAEVASHLEQCPDCEQQLRSLQSSLEVLQSCSSKSYEVESRRPSLWPELITQISSWEKAPSYQRAQGQDRFNGWVPASVMALAVGLMVAVSIPSIHQVFFGDEVADSNNTNRFDTDPDFALMRDPEGTISVKRAPQIIQTNYEVEPF